MRRKISCRIIDSIPLPAEGGDLHLGWCLDVGIYRPNKPSPEIHRRPSIALAAQIYTQNKGRRLDCYA